MSKMKFPLDLVWLDADGGVLAVLVDLPPCRTDPCPLYDPDGTETSVAVLETEAGGAAKYRLTMGATVRPLLMECTKSTVNHWRRPIELRTPKQCQLCRASTRGSDVQRFRAAGRVRSERQQD
jgi:hypothetical protein